jgi:radical SAM family RiPP maturation amino acid epimerase
MSFVSGLSPQEMSELGVKPVLFNRKAADPDYRIDLGDTRRLLERFHADDTFREACFANSREAASRWGLVRDPEEVRDLWDRESGRTLGSLMKDMSLSRSVRRYCAFTIEKHHLRKVYREEASPAHARFKAWRERQVVRSRSELGATKAEHIVHAPFAVEFGKGCSVGCWFCGVSAPKLGDQALYTPANARLWKECLEVLRDLLGPTSARWGFCYWATDPLDNPDYENYLVDFHELLGHFPQTTTAQPQRHVERVKALLKMAEEREGLIDRFSVITLKQWDRIHEAFSPEELLYVEAIPQNKQALNPLKAIAGRALEKRNARAAKGLVDPIPTNETSTIACVSGFIINMVDRTVRLIAPCNANERWPLGYWVVSHGTFHDGKSFQDLLFRMIDGLDDSVRVDDRLNIRPDLDFELLDDGFRLGTPHQSRTFRDPHGMHELGRYLNKGGMTVGEVASRLQDEVDVPMATTFHRCNRLLLTGMLDEQPDGASNSLGQWIPGPALVHA